MHIDLHAVCLLCICSSCVAGAATAHRRRPVGEGVMHSRLEIYLFCTMHSVYSRLEGSSCT
jgi:hypothetical protein